MFVGGGGVPVVLTHLPGPRNAEGEDIVCWNRQVEPVQVVTSPGFSLRPTPPDVVIPSG